MNSVELKHKIIRQIDSLNEADFEKVYHQLLEILKSANHYKLSEEENEAIDLALKVSEEGIIYSHDEVISEAKDKFPNLRFK
jgi:formylmethanofuran dehydrogenase subunit B